MSKVQLIERDCTDKCKSKQHGNELCSVISKRGITDSELCSYIHWKCSTCGQIFDSVGRTALHFAASCGRRRVLQWLIRTKGAQINTKDLESGYTPLHRSIFYGKINSAITLIQLGANLNVMDNNDLTPLEHALKDRLNLIEYNSATPCQVYVWGTNSNYTLGTGYQHSKQLPELLDAFHKEYPNVSVKQVCLDKFHFVLVSVDGRVFACGHGQGGRLGLVTENTVLVPQEIKFTAAGIQPFVCIEASIGRNHSLFLSESGHVWSCGLNTHHVLGIRPPPPQVLVPRQLPSLKQSLLGVCASRFHSVAWGTTVLFTWGLHAGQLGHDRTPNQTSVTPKLVTYFSTANTEIISVATSDGATVVSTKRGDVYVLHEYQCRKIASRQLNIVKTVVVGGHLNSKVSNQLLVERGGNELKVLALTSTGNLLVWQESWPQLTRCVYSLNRSLIVKDVMLNRSEVLFVTDDGEAFRGEFRIKKKKTQEITQSLQKSAFHEFLEKDECQVVKVTAFPHIHRAVKIQSDLKGQNFAVLQVDPCFSLVSVPQISDSNLIKDMNILLQDSDEMDSIHDAKFKVDRIVFPVHRYIISQKSEPLDLLIESNNSPDRIIEISNVHPMIFQQILLYIYTGSCDILKCGECPTALKNLNAKNKNNVICDTKEEDIHENRAAYEFYANKKQLNKGKTKDTFQNDPVRLLQEAAKRFGLKCLCKQLDNFVYVDGLIQKKIDKLKSVAEKLTFNRRFRNMCDVIVKSKNGAEIKAHRCILAARLEYFNNIFAVRWNMNSNRNVISLPIAHTILEHIIDYLYTDECKAIENSTDIDFICSLLVVCDQLFIDRLKELCEVALSALISLRNAAQMLQLAYIYNAPQLRRCVTEFICLNLSAILECRTLEQLDGDVLDDLSDFYCDWNVNLSKRVITPFSDAPSDEIVKSISKLYPVLLKSDESDDGDGMKVQSKANAKKKGCIRKSGNSENVKNKMKEDVSVSNDLDTSFEEERNDKKNVGTDEKWVKIYTEKQKHQKVVQARLRAVATAKEETVQGKPLSPDVFTKLTSKNEHISPGSSPITGPIFSFSSVVSPKSTSFPSSYDPMTSPTTYDVPIQKAVKISQKQRKKQAFESALLAEQLDKDSKKTSSAGKTDEFPVLSSSPKSVWAKVEAPVPVPIEEKKQNFVDIIAHEKKQKENWTKMLTKPLLYTQMEDKAIEELVRFYNAEELSDEHITIHRVDKGTYSAPLWVHANGKMCK